MAVLAWLRGLYGEWSTVVSEHHSFAMACANRFANSAVFAGGKERIISFLPVSNCSFHSRIIMFPVSALSQVAGVRAPCDSGCLHPLFARLSVCSLSGITM